MAKNKKSQPVVKQAAGPVIYVGPGFRDSILSTFGIFATGVPAEYENDPVMKHLFVSPDKLNEARAEVGRKGTALNAFYQQALERHKKGANK